MTRPNPDGPDSGRGEPLFRLGLIADIQYADREDGSDFSGTEQRHYRNALKIAREAVGHWNSVGVQAVVQLGDIIDGCNAKMGASETALAAVLSVLEQCTAKVRFDLIGNHELYNIPRDSLSTCGLRCQGPAGKTWWSSDLGHGWEAIFLDPYEYALIGVAKESEGYEKAAEMLRDKNPKVLGGGGDWFDGLPEELHRFVPYNGGVSQEQVAWLGETLAAAARSHRKALVFSHVPLFPAATKLKTVVWNAEDLLTVLHQHADTVVAVIAGHDHDGGYAVDSKGLHHVTMNSPLTASIGSKCWAILECYAEGRARFVASGRACVESGTCAAGKAYPELILTKGVRNEPSDDATF